MVRGESHPAPCSCGACIYRAFKHGRKKEGRQPSARTFFVYFIRSAFFIETLGAAMAGIKPRKVRFFRTGDAPPGVAERLAKQGMKLTPDAYDKAFFLVLRVLDYKELRKKAKIWNLGHPDRPPKYSHELLMDRIHELTRRRTLGVIKELAKRRRRQGEQEFLKGILRGKSFYTYYGRAGTDELRLIVDATRQELLTMADRNLSFRRPWRRAARGAGAGD